MSDGYTLVTRTRWVWQRVAILLLLPVFPILADAQETDTLQMELPGITVDAVRETESTASAPYALSVEVREPDELAYEPALSLDAVLRTMPGIWVNDRGHFALGERISVRGAGARAPFGVRGVQVLLDGIPLTMPDGQAVLDVVEPAVLRRMELLRSPASLYWGNGSGGVLFLSSDIEPGTSLVRARALGGAFGQRHLLMEASTTVGAHHIQAWASEVNQEGYRDYSEGSRIRAGTVGRFRFTERTRLRAVAAAALQDTENPSSLTRDQFETNPRLARADFVETNSGKESLQVQVGATVDHQVGLGMLTGTLYGIVRQLDNPLPFAYVDVDRTAGGFRGAFRGESGRFEWGIGADGALQHDVRKNFNNDAGTPGDEIDLDQIEDVWASGAFVYGRAELAPALDATAGVRYSFVRFVMDDRLIENGDESGSRLFTAWSPTAGIAYRLGGVLLFANYGTSFETPTTTELVNRPDMTGGFNPELQSQISRGFEVGARGAVGRAIFFDLALFHLHVDGRLMSFENELGREYFRDAGENLHRGVEAAVEWLPASGLEVQLSYTGSRFIFREESLRGNLMPGVPEHRLAAGLEGSRGGFWTRLEAEAVSEYFVDDQNTAVNDGYAVFDISLGHRGVTFGSARLEPFATVRNVFDTRYSGSVVVNAFGGRYFEPSPGRAVYAGLQVSL